MMEKRRALATVDLGWKLCLHLLASHSIDIRIARDMDRNVALKSVATPSDRDRIRPGVKDHACRYSLFPSATLDDSNCEKRQLGKHERTFTCVHTYVHGCV